MSRNAVVLWFTGLSGSGKSTVADALRQRLAAAGCTVLILDGDDVRARLHQNLGFSPEDIQENNRLIAELCRDNRARYDVILVPIISPYAASRRQARTRLEPDFFEIHFNASQETVVARDVKGLYAKAKAGEISNLLGFSPGAVYEPPSAPDLTIDSGCETVETSTIKMLDFINAKLPAGVRSSH